MREVREIKVRLWDIEEKKMFYADTEKELGYVLWMDLNGRVYTCERIKSKSSLAESHFCVSSWHARHHSDSIRLQYTEKKDESGKEIYDADILESYNKTGYSLYEVCFGTYDSGYGWYLREHRFQSGYEFYIRDCLSIPGKVIGNSCQNPELIPKAVDNIYKNKEVN